MRKHTVAGTAGTTQPEERVGPSFPFNSKQSTKGTGRGPLAWEALELRRDLELRWVN